jgi:hypothetical protein
LDGLLGWVLGAAGALFVAAGVFLFVYNVRSRRAVWSAPLADYEPMDDKASNYIIN